MKRQHKLWTIFVILTLSLGWTTTAWAAESDAAGRLLRGQVTAIGDNALTVQTPQTEVTLLTDTGTIFEVPGVQDATLADVNLDDLVVVHAVRNPQGDPLARRVAVIPGGSLEDKTLRGLVAAPDGATFQLRTGRGLVKVITDENTLFRIPNVENPTAADLRARMPVAVVGRFDAPDKQTFYAKAVAVLHPRPRRALVYGQVTAVGDSSLTLKPPRRDALTVTITPDTRFRLPGVSDPGLDDIAVGDRIGVAGRWNQDRSLHARWVFRPRPKN